MSFINMKLKGKTFSIRLKKTIVLLNTFLKRKPSCLRVFINVSTPGNLRFKPQKKINYADYGEK